MNRCFMLFALLSQGILLELAHAAPVEFLERSQFMASVQGVPVQGFETIFDSASSVAFPGFTATEQSSAPDIVSRTDYFSVGERAMGFTWNGDGSFSLEFDTPVDAFAADILDFGSCCGAESLVVTDETNSWTVTAATGADLPRGNLQFFGITSETPFSKLVFTSQAASTNDLIVFDELMFRAVPEPSGCAAFLVAMLVFMTCGRARR